MVSSYVIGWGSYDKAHQHAIFAISAPECGDTRCLTYWLAYTRAVARIAWADKLTIRDAQEKIDNGDIE